MQVKYPAKGRARVNTAPVVLESAGQLHAQCCAQATSKERILQYLTNAPVISESHGLIKDRIDPQAAEIENAWHSDGTWQWSSELVEYVQRHDVAVPGALVRHILSQ